MERKCRHQCRHPSLTSEATAHSLVPGCRATPIRLLPFFGEVGGNSGDGTAHLRCGPLIESGQAHEFLLPGMNMIDVLRRDLGFVDQGISPGDDQHDRLPVCDEAADGDGELMHGGCRGYRPADQGWG